MIDPKPTPQPEPAKDYNQINRKLVNQAIETAEQCRDALTETWAERKERLDKESEQS